MPEVTARTAVGAAIQAAKDAVKQESNRQPDASGVTAPQTEVTKPQDDVSSRMAAMARREKALRAQQREFQMQKQQWEQQRGASQQNDPQAEREKILADLKLRASEDPLAVVSELGLEVHRLRDSQSSAQKLLEQQKEEAAEFAKKQIQGSVRMLIESDQSYEAIRAMKAEDAVTELVQLSIQEGDELTVREAAEQVEAYLVEEAVKAASINKVKLKLTPAEKQELREAAEESLQTKTTTLSRTESPSKPLTAKDRRQRAIWAGMGLDPNTGKPLA